MAKAEVSALKLHMGLASIKLLLAAATILNNTIFYSITKHTHQTLEEEQETERGGGPIITRKYISSTNHE